MSSVRVDMDGLDKAVKKLSSLEDKNLIMGAVRAAAEHIKGKLAEYPPASEANVPHQRRWYERGYGSKWKTRSGAMHGKKTSEFLGRKWTTRKVAGGFGAEIGNKTSYARYVQDDDHRRPVFRVRGWKSIQQVAKSESDKAIAFIRDAIKRTIDR